MDNLKLLFLSQQPPTSAVTAHLGSSLISRLLQDERISFLDYKELYFSRGFHGTHSYLNDYIQKNGINAVLWFANGWEFYFDVPFFENLRKSCFLTLMTGDSALYYEVCYQYYAQAMDFAIVEEFITGVKLKQIGIESIPHFGFFDPDQYHKLPHLKKDIDVSFIGELRGRVGRRECLQYLADNGIRVETFGADSTNGPVSLEKKIEIINRSKINLDFNGPVLTTRLTRKHEINKRKKQLKGKCLEYAMCGGFSLAENAPGLERLFELNREIAVFNDKEELLEKVRYFLKNDEERERIAQAGYARALREYNAKVTNPALVAEIDHRRLRRVYKPSEIYLDEEFLTNYTTYRVYLMLKFFKSGRWRFALEEMLVILKNRKIDWWQVREFLLEEFLGSFPRVKALLKSLLKRGIKMKEVS